MSTITLRPLGLHVALLSALSLAPPARAAEELTVRELPMERVDVKEANAILRSILNVRKSAIDVRRQVIVLSDTPEVLAQAEALLARVDSEVPTWSVALVAVAGDERTVLRTATLAQGPFEVAFGGSGATATDPRLQVAARIVRASSGEIELDWSSSMNAGAQWTESARAVETLRDGATVTIASSPSPERQRLLALLVGVGGARGAVEALVLEVRRDAPDERRAGSR